MLIYCRKGKGRGFRKILGGSTANIRHTNNSGSPKHHSKFIKNTSEKPNKSFLSPDNVLMREVVDLLQEGDFTDGRKRHSFLAVCYPDPLQCHESAFVLEIASFIHRPVSSIADLSDLFIFLSHSPYFKRDTRAKVHFLFLGALLILAWHGEPLRLTQNSTVLSGRPTWTKSRNRSLQYAMKVSYANETCKSWRKRQDRPLKELTDWTLLHKRESKYSTLIPLRSLRNRNRIRFQFNQEFASNNAKRAELSHFLVWLAEQVPIYSPVRFCIRCRSTTLPELEWMKSHIKASK